MRRSTSSVRHLGLGLPTALLLSGLTACGGSAMAPSAEAPMDTMARYPQPEGAGHAQPGYPPPAQPSPALAPETEDRAPADEEAAAPVAAVAPMELAPAGRPAPAAPRRDGTSRPGKVAGPAAGEKKLAADAPMQPAARGIRAGEWDDNANYRDFLGYIGQRDHLGIDSVDVTARRFVVVRDSAGKGVPGCVVTVRDEGQKQAQLTTTASGRAILFPRAMGLDSGALTATTQCQGARAAARFDTTRADDAVILTLPQARQAIQNPVVDVAFVLDTTGSMSEEIREVKETLRRVTDALASRGVRVRIGLVEYKDKGDEFVTRTYPMTTDVQAFSQRIAHIQASGGGDMPENVNEGLEVALRDLTWSKQSVARLAFMIADAPPQLGYQDVQPYSVSAKDAASRGIQVFTVATSGMNELGQAVFRQIAQLTGGTNMFVLRGGAGPQSTGAGDAASSCGGTHENFASGNLDQLIARKVAQEIAALEADPMRIAGLGQDERAKPCAQRILAVAN